MIQGGGQGRSDTVDGLHCRDVGHVIAVHVETTLRAMRRVSLQCITKQFMRMRESTDGAGSEILTFEKRKVEEARVITQPHETEDGR